MDSKSVFLLLLQADPTSPARYFCSHAGGVHAVGLPMVTRLAELASDAASGRTARAEADATLSCLQVSLIRLIQVCVIYSV